MYSRRTTLCHHPTEVRATLSAAKAGAFSSDLCCYLQPHPLPRARCILNEGLCSGAFNLADVVLLLDIYPAERLRLIEGVSTPVLVEEIRSFWTQERDLCAGLRNDRTYVAENAREGVRP
jgi:UDP-N-acetylmuramate-alanine ligase